MRDAPPQRPSRVSARIFVGPPYGSPAPLTGPRRGVPVRGSLIKLKRPSRVSDPLTGRDMGRRANLQKSDGGRVPRPWRDGFAP